MRNLFTFLTCTLLTLVGCSSDPELFGASASVCVTGMGGTGGAGIAGTGGMGGDDMTTSSSSGASSTASSSSSSTTSSSSSGTPVCMVDTDCMGITNECRHPACKNGECTVWVAPEGTPTSGNTSGDCLTRQCDGLGNKGFILDQDDPKDDNNACTTDTCTGAGITWHYAVPAGSSCALPNFSMGVCNGVQDNSKCVECLQNYLYCPPDKMCFNGTCI